MTQNADARIDGLRSSLSLLALVALIAPFATRRIPPSSPRPTNVIEIPQPLNDTTQNVEGKGEYVGTTFWGTRWTTNLKYSGSFYDNDVKQIDIENPFCITCSLFTGVNRGPNALRWTPLPSNNANAITSNTAVDLPFWKSRFVNTFQYNAMRQDDAFVNTGTNGTIMPPPCYPR